ncbi:MAG: hypothetical protein RQ760_02740 [Sedimentisphaerales bacterium]|nr:hypothetical protein [Sedimentisphaerales bacterium]
MGSTKTCSVRLKLIQKQWFEEWPDIDKASPQVYRANLEAYPKGR